MAHEERALSSKSSEAVQQVRPSQQAATLDRFEQIQRGSEARQRLQEDVIGFLRRMKERGESALGRNPNAEDLLPYFQRYAWSIIEAKHKGAILATPSLSEAKVRIQAAVDNVLAPICKRSRREGGRATQRAGIWLRTVKIAADAVDLGDWKTPFGRYNQRVFMSPRRRQLRALLLVQAQTLIQEFVKLRAKESAATQSNFTQPRVEIVPQFPKRAQWLKERLRERDWNTGSFNLSGGPDRKTIHKILRGESVTETTLDKAAEALSSYRGPRQLKRISRAEIPNE
jgi:hypothetical protein